MTRLRFLRCFAMAAAAALVWLVNEAAATSSSFMLDSLHDVPRRSVPVMLSYFERYFGLIVDDCLRKAAA